MPAPFVVPFYEWWSPPAAGGGGDPPPEPTQLMPPSLAAGAASDTLTTRTVPIAVAGPLSWPVGVIVQLQTKRGAGAWTNAGAPVAASANLAFAREAATYTVEVRGIATNGAPLTDSDPSGVLTLSVPAAPSVGVLADATPLVCDVALFPGSPEAVTAAAGGAQATLIGRADTDNVLRVTNIRSAIEQTAVTPTSVVLELEGPDGVLLTDTIPAAAPGVYRRGVSRAAFDPSRGTLTLRLILTAPDTSRTTIEFAVPQGVRG